MNKKIRIKMIPLIILIVISSIMLASCKPSNANTHEHSYASQWSSDSSSHWHAATCEHTEETSNKENHTWDEGVVTREATCSTNGIISYTCTVCGYVKQELTDKLAHTPSTDWSSNGTYHYHKCEICDEAVDEHVHTWNEGVVIEESTCSKKGSIQYACTVCGFEKIDSIPTLEHEFSSNWMSDAVHHFHVCEVCGDATDVAKHTVTDEYYYTKDDGDVDNEYHWRICETCGYIMSKEEHHWDEGVITSAPSCTNPGEMIKTCLDCNHQITIDISDLGHQSSEEWTYNEETHWHVCSNCDAHTFEAQHDYAQGVVTHEATCTEPGEIRYECQTCGYIKIDSIPALGHKGMDEWAHDENEHWHICSECGLIEAKGEHVLVHEEGEIILAPTCTEGGRIEFACAICEYKYYVEIDALGHDIQEGIQYDDEKHWHTCSRCEDHVDSELHNLQETEVLKAPTCTEGGLIKYQCLDCLYEITIEVEALGHDLADEWELDSQSHWHRCSRCNEKIGSGLHELNDYNSCTICNYNEGIEHLVFTLNEEGTSYSITGFKDSLNLSTLYIPVIYQGLPVTSIGLEAFKNCLILNTVIISPGILTLSNGAFMGCTNLSNATICDSVIAMGNSTFSGCTSLEGITLPSAITSIGESMFSGCSMLSSISIPEAVSSIGSKAFENCTSLEAINLNCKIKVLEDRVFYGRSKLETVQLGEEIISIGSYVFYECRLLKNINIPAQTTAIGAYTFYNCKALAGITLPADLSIISERLFYGCSGLLELAIPDEVIEIQHYALYDCDSLVSLDLNNVKRLLTASIGECDSLVTLTMSYTIESIDTYAFSNINLENFYYNGTIDEWCMIKFNNFNSNPMRGANNLYMINSSLGYILVNDISVPSGITQINNYQFYGFKGKTITLPAGITSIGESAFSYASGIESISLPDGVTTIGMYAFFTCENLKTIRIPSSITDVGVRAFEGCNKLIYSEDSANSGYYLGNETNSYVLYAKAKNNSTGEIIIGAQTNAILDNALNSLDDSITIIHIKAKITEFNMYQLSSCKNLTEILLPITLTNLYGGFVPPKVFYEGSEEGWKNVEVSSNILEVEHTVYFHSLYRPTTSGNYWYYRYGDTIGIW